MNNNVIIEILKREEQKRKLEAENQEWGTMQRNRLVEVLEKAGATMTDHLWDLLLFKINGLRINSDGKVCYLSYYKESKKIMELLRRYNNIIVQNFDYITKY